MILSSNLRKFDVCGKLQGMGAEVLRTLVDHDGDWLAMPFSALLEIAKWNRVTAISIGCDLNRGSERVAVPFILQVVSYLPDVGFKNGREGLAVGLTKVQYSWIFSEELDFNPETRDSSVSGDSDNYWKEMEQINAGGLVIRLRQRTQVVPVWLVKQTPGVEIMPGRSINNNFVFLTSALANFLRVTAPDREIVVAAKLEPSEMRQLSLFGFFKDSAPPDGKGKPDYDIMV